MPIFSRRSKSDFRAASLGATDDPLGQFEAELAPESAGDPAAAPQAEAVPHAVPDLSLVRHGHREGSASVPLDAVRRLGVPVSWSEGVAIVEATCGAILSTGGTGVPGPADVAITAEGVVALGSRGTTGDAVQRLARMLQDLTSGQAIPAPLRLFTVKWAQAEDGHTIAEFAAELAYFARPNGAELIRQVHRRCLEASPSAATAPQQARAALTAPKAAQKQPEAQKKPEAKKAASRPAAARRVLVAVAAVMLLAIAGAGVVLLQSEGAGGDSSQIVAGLLARAGEFARSLGEVRVQVGDIQAQLAAHLGSETPESTGAASASTPAATATAGRGTTRPSASATTPALAARRGPASATSALPTRVADTPAPAADRVVEAAETTAIGAVPVPPPPSPEAMVSAIYSSGDAGVDPPKMLYPQVPPGPIVFGRDDDLNVMEIIIGDDGAVERVRLLSPPRRMTDMMLLSGAKTWKFTPASKDGESVRYRLAVSWAVGP